MLRHKIVLLSMLALLSFIAACRGEPPATSSSAPVAAASRSAPLPTEPPPKLTPTPTYTPSTPTEPPPGPRPTEPIGTFPLATNSPPATEKPPGATEMSTPTTEPAPTTANSPAEDDVAAIHQIIQGYWEALNDYDVDRAITMLEEGYRAAEEELIRKDIGRMKLFRVKLGITEETPLALNEEGNYETYLSVKTPVDTRMVLMVFRKIDGQWWIVFSDQVD